MNPTDPTFHIKTSDSDLASNWLAYHRAVESKLPLTLQQEEEQENFRSVEELDRLVRNAPEIAWAFILEIFLLSETDFQRACLAAGPLEDLMVKHGALFIERIELVAARDAGFLELLTGIWKSGIPDSVWERIQRVINSGQ